MRYLILSVSLLCGLNGLAPSAKAELTPAGLVVLKAAHSFDAVSRAASGPRFQLSFPASTHAGPITGRVFVFVSRRAAPEPRLQAGLWLGDDAALWHRCRGPAARRDGGD